MIFQLSDHFINALSWTVIHSIWQGTLIAFLLYILLRKISIKNSNLRYNTSLLSLGVLTLCSIVTFLCLYYIPESPATLLETNNPSGTIFIGYNELQGSAFSLKPYVKQFAPMISQFWLIGVMLFTLKFAIGYLYLQYLNSPTGRKKHFLLTSIKKRLAEKMQVTKNVGVYITDKVSSPLVIGWIKPIILFPIRVVTMLSDEELEIIFAHELAHIKRNDWMINVFQSITEIIFYYHPAMWWISTQIRSERENCCDDMALEYVGNQISYTKVLVKLKELEISTNPILTLGFFKSGNTLLNRIKRILGQPQNQNIMKEKFLALAVLLCITAGFAFTKINKEKIQVPFLSAAEIQVENDRSIIIPPSFSSSMESDTLPKQKGSSRYTISVGDRIFKIEKEDGEIISMNVDGEQIDPKDYNKYEREMEDLDIYYGEEGQMFKLGNGHDEDIFQFKDGFSGNQFRDLFENMDSIKSFKWEEFGNMFSEDDFPSGFSKSFKMVLPENMDSLFSFQFDNEGGSRIFNFQDGDLSQLEGLIEGLEGMNFNFDFDELEGLGEMRGFEGLEDLFGDESNRYGSRKSGKISDRISNEMNKDGFLKIGEINDIELTGKALKINGKKQASTIFEKYKKIFEDYSGTDLKKDSKITFKLEGKEIKKNLRKKGLRRI